ncbi:MAG: ATP-dependent helicase [Neisseriaceae bacterium]|nr:ATP-dependent helicase [Neisseriaceae bacterium]
MKKDFDWTEEQKAIFSPCQWGNTLISACAGSGKSTALVERCIHHVLRPDMQKWQSIALISFTNKSVADLRAKVEQKFSQKKTSEIRANNGRILISTFHGFLITHVLTFHEAFRCQKITFDYSQKVGRKEDWLKHVLKSKIIVGSTDAKQDFLMETALEVIQQNGACQKYLQAKFHGVYIDETQDNNKIQYDIVDKLMNLDIECVLVGDSRQTIYQFRGASPEAFEEKSQSNDFIQLKLSKNHRCHDKINQWANQSDWPENRDVEEIIKNNRKTHYGVFGKYSDQQIKENIRVSATLENEGLAFLVSTNQNVKDIKDKFPKVKIMKRPDLVEKVSDPQLLLALYKLALPACGFNEYHFTNELSEEQIPKNPNNQRPRMDELLKKLKVFRDSKALCDLEALNAFLPILKEDELQGFLESLNQEDIVNYFTCNPEKDIVAMTIHSSKGLEFNNVIIYKSDFSQERDAKKNQEKKRLRYVAFTRARKRLFIVA